MRSISISLILSIASLSALAYDGNQSQEFREKYRIEEQGAIQIRGFDIPDFNKTESIDKKAARQFEDQSEIDVKHSDLQRIKELNASKELQTRGFDIKRVTGDMNKTDKNAEALNLFFRSLEAQKRIDEQTRFILKDEAFGARQYAGEYKDIIDDRLNDPNNPVLSSVQINNGNKFLDKNEQIIVVISSSIPKSTLRSYFQDIDAINAPSDVKFVLRGLVGNDVSTIKPTIEYLSTIVSKSGKPVKSENNETYKVSVSINPKITQKYGIDRVPAVLFIKNYNPAIEEPKRLDEAMGENEEYYIAYGASRLDYSLTKINEKAKSEGVKRLINALQKRGFFGEDESKKAKP
jgi:type-F conjugative transfer system pilin assembly protein TrbC